MLPALGRVFPVAIPDWDKGHHGVEGGSWIARYTGATTN
jgi:hypothetical protein